MPTRGPRRSRTRSKVARWLTAATRPDISAKTQIPMTPRTVAQTNESPNRAPTWALVTRSPMSTKPPMAVRTPSATAKSFFTCASSPGAWSSSPDRCLGPIQTPRHPLQLGCQGGVGVGVTAYHRDPYLGEEVVGVRQDGRHPRVHPVVARLGLLGAEMAGGPPRVRLTVQRDHLLVLAEHPALAGQLEHERHGRHVAGNVLHRQMRLIAPRGVLRSLWRT